MNDATMLDIQPMLEQAKMYRKQARYDDAIGIYAPLWSEHRPDLNKWDSWSYAICLRKTGDPESALDVCRHGYELDSGFSMNNNQYAWCIYDIEIKGHSIEDWKDDEERFLQAVDAIVRLTSQDQYSPFTRAVMARLKYLNKKQNIPYLQVLKWTDLLDSEQLSTDCLTYEDDRGRSRELASDRENWYVWRSRALERRGQYEDCIALCEAALADLPSFHFGNNTWLRWRIAKSLIGLGWRSEARERLQSILNSKKEWFVQHEMAQLLFEDGEVDRALDYAIEAAMNHGEVKNKYKLFLLMGQILEQQTNLEKARTHIELAAAAWEALDSKRMPSALNAIMERLGIDIPVGSSSKELYYKLRTEWHKQKLAGLPEDRGVVKCILPNGKAGFVTSDAGQDYYFKTSSFAGPRKYLKPGINVEFHLKPSYDPKKKRDTLEAIHLKTTNP